MLFRNAKGRLAALAGIVTIVPLLAAPAEAAPPTPSFRVAPEGYTAYQGQSTCDATPKAGVVEFKDLVLATYPGTGNSGIGRDCSVGGKSEHKEGRAWDWHVSATSQGHIAKDLLDWLLAEREGQAHALLRRLGIMYVIWNRQIFKAYQAGAGWQPYSGSNPHTDHVHFSFGWPGAKKETTWWTGRGPDRTSDVYGVVTRGGSGQTEVHALSREADYRRFSVHAATGLGPTSLTRWAFGIGDYTGDGTPDLIAVNTRDNDGRNTAAHVFSGESQFRTAVLHKRLPDMGPASLRSWQFTAGDYNEDGRADLIAVNTRDNGGRNTAAHVFNAADAYGTFLLHKRLPDMGSASLRSWQFTAGDYNEDGRADLIAVNTRDNEGRNTAAHVLNAADAYGTFLLHKRLPDMGSASLTAWRFTAGDHNVDGRADLIAVDTRDRTGTTAIHALDASSGYDSYIAHAPSALHPTNTTSWQFHAHAP